MATFQLFLLNFSRLHALVLKFFLRQVHAHAAVARADVQNVGRLRVALARF